MKELFNFGESLKGVKSILKLALGYRPNEELSGVKMHECPYTLVKLVVRLGMPVGTVGMCINIINTVHRYKYNIPLELVYNVHLSLRMYLLLFGLMHKLQNTYLETIMNIAICGI